MKSSDLADSTARALDLLPSGDPAASDPRMLRDARLVEEARTTREAAADVWLAVSPLHVAPPEILHAVLAKIDPPTLAKLGKPQRYLPWLAAVGWAAAAAIAFLLWPKSQESIFPRAAEIRSTTPDFHPESASRTPHAAHSKPSDERLRKEILRLQARLADFRAEHGTRSPRVISLSAPGAARRTPDEARQRVQTILTNALRSAMEIESGAPSDPASLVIERGWLPGGLPAPEEGGIIRHRNFPENNWQEMGLLRSKEGEYFDASANIIWSADPEGRGFIGRNISQQDDMSRFSAEPSTDFVKSEKPAVKPEGFIIEDPATHTAEVYIDNLPPPDEGKEQIIRITDSTGKTTSTPISQLHTAAEPEAETSIYAPTGTINPFQLSSVRPTSASASVPLNSYFASNGIAGNLFDSNTAYSKIVGFITQNNGAIVSFEVVESSIGISGGAETVILGSSP